MEYFKAGNGEFPVVDYAPIRFKSSPAGRRHIGQTASGALDRGKAGNGYDFNKFLRAYMDAMAAAVAGVGNVYASFSEDEGVIRTDERARSETEAALAAGQVAAENHVQRIAFSIPFRPEPDGNYRRAECAVYDSPHRLSFSGILCAGLFRIVIRILAVFRGFGGGIRS